MAIYTLGKLHSLRELCRTARTPFMLVLIRHLRYRLQGKNILSGDNVTIHGLNNISTGGLLKIAMNDVNLTDSHDRTFLNVTGRTDFEGDYTIGRGCRLLIGRNAVATFGVGYMNCNTMFVIGNGIAVGDGSVTAWGCQFLDEDFHRLHYAGKPTDRRTDDQKIEIGSHVWIGSNVSVLKGAAIPDGCVVAAGSVVTSKFDAKNALIAGNPARVIRENISWE